jgi:putative cardiolipin synthase
MRSMFATALFLASLLHAAPSPAAAPTQATEQPTEQPTRPTLRRAFELMQGGGGDSEAVALDRGADAWVARWRAIAGAKRTIDTSYFIVTNDVFGLAFLGHLYLRAHEGVQIKLLLDGRGSVALSLPFAGLDELQELVATGNASVHIYNPPLLQIPRTLLERSAVPVSAGTHSKILIVDDELAITGGRNVGAGYFAARGEVDAPITDTDVLFTRGAPVQALDEALHHEFNHWGKERVRRDAVNLDRRDDFLRIIAFAMDAWLKGEVPRNARTSKTLLLLEAAALARIDHLPSQATRDEARPYLRQLVRVRSMHGRLSGATPASVVVEAKVAAATGRAERAVEANDANDAIVLALSSARRRVWLQSPYFMLTPRLLAALTRASERGVEIVALTNGPNSSDNASAQALFIDTWPELEARMPTLRVFVGARNMLHTKRVIIDDELTLVGSHNLDPLSAHLNSEVVVALWSRAMNESASALFTAALEGGEVLEYRIRRDARGARRDRNGRVLVAFGPEHHLPARRLEELRTLKEMLFSIRNIWDFDFVAW